MPRADVTIRFSTTAPAFAYLTGARVQTRTAACSAFGTGGNPAEAEVSGAGISCAATPPIVGFPLYAVYSNIASARGFTPVPESNDRYWEDEFTYPTTGDLYTTLAGLNSAIASAQPGTVLRLANGTYTGDITIGNSSGITVCAQSIGGVTLNGNCQVLVETATDVDFLGFTFSGNNTRNPIIWGRYWSDGLRIAFCRWTNMTSNINDHNWIWLQGSYSRFCYNTLDYKGNSGRMVTLTATYKDFASSADPLDGWASYSETGYPTPTHIRLDHNVFMDHQPGETGTDTRTSGIRFGSADVWHAGQDAWTLVDNNYFYDWNTTGLGGDSRGTELFEIKISGFIAIRNYVRKCFGHFSHRAGHRATFYANFFDGEGEYGAGALEGSGQDDWMFCNYLKDLNYANADEGVGIWSKSGTADLTPPGYWPCEDMEASFNTLLNNANQSSIDHGGTTGTGTIKPQRTRWYNNVADAYASYNVVHEDTGLNADWQANVFYPAGVTKAGITNETPEWGWVNGVYVPVAGGNLHTTGTAAFHSIVTVDAGGSSIPSSNPNIGAFQSPPQQNPMQEIIDGAGVDNANVTYEIFPTVDVYSNIMEARGYTPVPASLLHYWEWTTREKAFEAYPVYDSGNSNHNRVTSLTALATAVGNAVAGDYIFVAVNNYTGGPSTITISNSGNATNRITVVSEIKHGASMKGDVAFVLSGDYIDLFGFDFSNTTNDNVNIITITGDYCRSAFHNFEQIQRTDPDAVQRGHFVDYPAGYAARICYNTFNDLDNDHKPLRVAYGGDHYVRFDHNRIIDLIGYGDDFEAVQIGGGNPAQYEYALIDHNYVLRHNNVGGSKNRPEPETVADKTSGNMYIRNAFVECCDHPNARASHRSTWYGNFIIGSGVEGSGGVWGGGDECWILCNYIKDTGQNERALWFRNGDDVNYWASDNGEASFNTIWNCDEPISFGGGATGPNDPTGNDLYNNAVMAQSGSNAIVDTDQTNTTFAGNVFSTPVGMTIGGNNTEDDPDLIPSNGYYVPSLTGNCKSTGAAGWLTDVCTVDIIGNTIPQSSPDVGCFQWGADLTTDPVEYIKDNAGASVDYYFTDNTIEPYTVNPSNAEIYTSYADMLGKAKWRDGFSAYRIGGTQYIQIGGGYNYYFLGDGTKDLIIDLSGIDAPGLAYPIDIRNYNNVLIRGVLMSLIEQQYEWYSPIYLPQISGPYGNYSPASIYKRLSPFGGAIRLDVKGKITIEGCDIRINGQEGDFIIYRGNYATSHVATGVRVLNTRVSGQVTGDDFDGLTDDNDKPIYTTHSDFFHNQGSADSEMSLCAQIQVENITYRTSQNGMIIQARGQSGGGVNDWPYKTDLLFSKCDFRQCNDWNKTNPVLGPDTYGGNTGFAATGALSSLTMDNITYGAPDDTMRAWGVYTENFWDSGEADNVWINANTNPTELTYTQTGDTQIDRAPADHVGYNYISPFGDVV